MSTNEFDYYLVYGTNIPNCPAVELDEDENRINYFFNRERINLFVRNSEKILEIASKKSIEFAYFVTELQE